MKKLNSINYNRPLLNTTRSLFDFWENRKFPQNMSTPTISSIDYRVWMLKLFLSFLNPSKDTIFSIGCGNGIMELELKNNGFSVVATDLNETAIKYAKSRNLKCFRFDIVEDSIKNIGLYSCIYADGLLGHIWSPDDGFLLFFEKIYNILQPKGIAILSNDLCDNDSQNGTLLVSSDPNAQFYKPKKHYIASEAKRSGLFHIINELIYYYCRPGRGIRRREILICKAK